MLSKLASAPPPVVVNVPASTSKTWADTVNSILHMRLFKGTYWVILLTLLLSCYSERVRLSTMAYGYIVAAGSGKLHDTALRDAVRNHGQIEAVLQTLLEATGSSRTFFFQFHNGKESLQGVPFLYASNTGERDAVGVASAVVETAQVPIETVMGFITEFNKGNCVDKKLADADAALSHAMKALGTLRILACPVFTANNREAGGYVSMTLTQGYSLNDEAAAIEKLKYSAKLLGVTLSSYLSERSR